MDGATTLRALVTLLLTSLTGFTDGELHNQTMRGFELQMKSFTSKGYLVPINYPGNKEVYVYYIEYTRATGCIQIVAEDFDLSPFSIFKVYDPDTTHESVYQRDLRPVYQSSTNKLRLVFKPSTEQDGYTNIYNGFKINYTFVDYKRDQWWKKGMPSVGFCPEVPKTVEEYYISLRGSNGSRSWPSYGQSRPYLYDCVWILRAENRDRLWIRLKQVNLKSGFGRNSLLTVRRDGHSEGEVMIELKHDGTWSYGDGWASYSDPQDRVFVAESYYVRLQAYMSPADILQLAVSTSKFSVENEIDPLYSSPARLGKCPYRFDQETNACVDYWDMFLARDLGCSWETAVVTAHGQ